MSKILTTILYLPEAFCTYCLRILSRYVIIARWWNDLITFNVLLNESRLDFIVITLGFRVRIGIARGFRRGRKWFIVISWINGSSTTAGWVSGVCCSHGAITFCTFNRSLIFHRFIFSRANFGGEIVVCRWFVSSSWNGIEMTVLWIIVVRGRGVKREWGRSLSLRS